MNVLRKLNIKLSIFVILGFLALLAIAGSFQLSDLLQSLSVPRKNLFSAFVLYFVFFFACMGVFTFINMKINKRFKVSMLIKTLIITIVTSLMVPGLTYFPEAYGVNNTLFAVGLFLLFSILLLAIFVQKFSNQQIGSMIYELKNISNKSLNRE